MHDSSPKELVENFDEIIQRQLAKIQIRVNNMPKWKKTVLQRAAIFERYFGLLPPEETK